MDARTRKALEGSIAKWEAIVAGTGVDAGTDNCPLCALFAPEETPAGAACVGCPVFVKTGNRWCSGSPYTAFVRAVPYRQTAATPHQRRLARAELDFLRSLLPAESSDA